mmetsp:Transcript_30845/g.55908  ORF Transcript_30845/g.55908 Transcript_30845/m.55908 type:complete len:150 (+) Transcript_30845:183-632(+)
MQRRILVYLQVEQETTSLMVKVQWSILMEESMQVIGIKEDGMVLVAPILPMVIVMKVTTSLVFVMEWERSEGTMVIHMKVSTSLMSATDWEQFDGSMVIHMKFTTTLELERIGGMMEVSTQVRIVGAGMRRCPSLGVVSRKSTCKVQKK